MAVVKCKPTSPGRRHVVKVVNPEAAQGQTFCSVAGKTGKSVVVTTMAVSPLVISVVGHKQAYRIVDFKRNKDGIPAVVERLE